MSTGPEDTPPVMPGSYLFPKNLPFHHTRNPVTHSGRGFRAKFFSNKNGRMIRCESLLEFDCLHLFEFARQIESFAEQPISLNYRLAGRSRRYTPDFVVHWRDGGGCYVEVKPAEILAAEQNPEKFEAIREWFAARGESFVVLTDRVIQRLIRLQQVKDLLWMRPKTLNDTMEQAMSRLDGRCLPFSEAVKEVGDEQTVRQLLALRWLSCDLDQPIQDETLVMTFQEKDDETLFI